MKLTQEDIKNYATEDEKVSLKESIANERSMKFVNRSDGDLDQWEEIIREMSPQELKDATFELQSAIAGINHQTQRYHIPRLDNEYWSEMKERRQLFRKYLNRLEKVKLSMEKDSIEYDDFGDEIKKHPDYEPDRDQDLKFEDIEKYATEDEKKELKEGEKQGGKDDWMKKIKCPKCGKDSWTGKIKFGNNLRKCLKCKSEIKEAANPKGKTRKVDNPYEVYRGYGSLQDWVWKVLKHYQTPDKERSNPYARVFCAVSSPFTFGGYDMGDTYCNQIPNYKYE